MQRILLLLSACVALSVASTVGTNFQLVFMENIVEAPKDLPLEVHISNIGNIGTTVSISYPSELQIDCATPSSQFVPANSNVKMEICWKVRLLATDFWPVFKTVIVSSDQPVMVYGVNKEFYSADGFYAIPTNELSYSYTIASIDEANLGTQFAISATEDCEVRVTLPNPADLRVEVNYRGLRYTNGDSYQLQLSQFESYVAQSRGDLTGAKVIASKPIAVFSGNIRNKQDSGSRDHLAAQLHPVGNWGTRFALQPVPRDTNFGDVVRVISKVSDTDVTIQSNIQSISQRIVSPGSYFEFQLENPSVITASKDVEVVQMVRSQSAKRISDVADPCLFLNVAQDQWLQEYISPRLTYSRDGAAYDKNFAFIAIASGSESGLRLNGGSVGSIFQTVDGVAMGWVSILGSSTNRFTHVFNTPFTVVVYGASDRESYGFALGADLGAPGCQDSLMIKEDGLDNDCDGEIDEEVCNDVDDDNDGLIDEDCRLGSIEAVGNDYVIMFMENNVDDNPNAVSLLEIYVSGVDETASFPITMTTEQGSVGFDVIAGQMTIIDEANLPSTLRQMGSGIDTKAIRIQATQNVVVYGMNKQTFSTDGFLAFPVDVVGTLYYTAHYYPGQDKNEFGIAATATDGPTTVIVTMPNNNQGSSCQFGNEVLAAGRSTSFTLTSGQTAQFQAVDNDQNLNGAKIESDKPISVFSGNVRARIDPTTANSRDHLVHQLAPVNTWGQNFITLPIPRQAERGDIFTLTASLPNTNVVVHIYDTNGNNVSTQNIVISGAYAQFEVGSNQYAVVRANRPVQLMQFVKTTGDKLNDNADPAMILVPPTEQWSRNYQLSTPRTGQENAQGNGFEPFDNFVLVAIDRTQRDGLRLQGNPINNLQWTNINVAGFGDFSVTEFLVESGRSTLGHIDENVYFQALMYGRADRESYGLPLGMRLVIQDCIVSAMVEADGIDNDCDGEVDEELCNGMDDDSDGVIDEDCGQGGSFGTSFYVTYMDNEVEYPKYFDLELYVAVVGDQPASVSVRAPLVAEPTYSTEVTIQPGEVQGYGFSYTLRNVGQGVFNNVFYVRSSENVVVYGVNKEKFSNDGFLVYPENSLGFDYYTMSWSPSTLKTEFAVIGTQANTVVSITLPSNRLGLAVEYNGRTYSSGQSFDVTLQKYQVYQAQSDGDLTGTKISSSNRVAVYSGNVRTLISLSASRDHLVQQMYDITKYGTSFYVVPFPDRTVGDVLKIVASQDSTQVRVNNVVIGNMNAGGFLEYQLNSASRVLVTSDRPVMVTQFVKSQDGRDNPEEADPAMFLVPHGQQFISEATFITPVYSGGRTPGSDYVNYVTMVMQNGNQGQVQLNDQSLNNPNWVSIANTDYVTTTFQVGSGSSHRLRTTGGATFYGRLYGRADRESYAFPIGMNFA